MSSSTRARLGVVLAAVLAAVLAPGVSGCAASPAASAPAEAADAITVSDAWVKAADSGMSAAFGELANDSGSDVTVVSATSAASSTLELHETVEDDAGSPVMRESDGGFVVPADETYTLEPGGSHLMLMDLTAPLSPGDEVTMTLTFSDDSTLTFTAPVKEYSGANESYEHEGH